MSNFDSGHAEALLSTGAWENAINYTWDAIDSGEIAANAFLAELFEKHSLFAFAQDHWESVAISESNLAQRGRLGLFGNYLWIGNYEKAQSIVSMDSSLTYLNNLLAEQRARGELMRKPNSIENIEQLIAGEESLVSLLSDEFSLQNQVELIHYRDALSNYASQLSYGINSQFREISISIPIGGTFIQRPLAQSLGTPTENWWRMAHAAGLLLSQFSADIEIDEDPELFNFACKQLNIAVQKLLMHKGFAKVDANDTQIIETLSWGLSHLDPLAAGVVSGLLSSD